MQTCKLTTSEQLFEISPAGELSLVASTGSIVANTSEDAVLAPVAAPVPPVANTGSTASAASVSSAPVDVVCDRSSLAFALLSP